MKGRGLSRLIHLRHQRSREDSVQEGKGANKNLITFLRLSGMRLFVPMVLDYS
jgi:hypothetical protein